MGNSLTTHKEVLVIPGETKPTEYEFGNFYPFGKVMNPCAVYVTRKQEVPIQNLSNKSDTVKFSKNQTTVDAKEALQKSYFKI